MEEPTLFSVAALNGKILAISSPSTALKSALEGLGASIVDTLHADVDLLVVEPQDNFQQQWKANSMGIPIMTKSYLTAQLDENCLRTRSTKRSLSSSSSESPYKKARVSESRAFRAIEKRAVSQAELQIEKMKSSTRFMNKVVALEGNIGAGKSTLCAKVKKMYPDRCSLYKEQGNEKFLKLFYSNPGKYGFAYQWGMLKTRRYQLALAQQDVKYGRIPPKQFYFWDRSMVGDYIFALWNHLLGGISTEEMVVYEDEFGGSMKEPEKIDFLSSVSCYVLLNDEPSNCKERVENLRCNESESSIPLSYYEGIDDVHFHLFVRCLMPKQIAPILVVNWGDYDNEKSLWDSLAKVMTGDKTTPSVFVGNDLANADAEEGDVIYKSQDQIEDAYQRLTAGTLAKPAKTEKKVFIPEDVMTIPNVDKGVIENDYGVVFYENAYKRVVLWHLSHGQDVYFFPSA